MARPRSDGLPSQKTNKRKLTNQFVDKVSSDKRSLVWDTQVYGFALAVYPTSKVWKVIYPFGGRTRWYTIGKVGAIDLKDARKLAAQVRLKVATDVDPQAERRASRSRGTFEELATQYREQYSKKHNKSWRQADKLVQRFLVPRWGKLQAGAITRSDVKSVVAGIASESVASQTLAHASAIFGWALKEEVAGVKVNPCARVDRPEGRSRERVLSDSEVPLFWEAFDSAGLLRGTALKLILLLGQRPGEVLHLHRAHIKDDWWEMPGEPVLELNWHGTKNKMNHRVWLPKVARELLEEVDGDQPFARIREPSDESDLQGP